MECYYPRRIVTWSAVVPARITPQEKTRKGTNNLVIKIELTELFYFPFHFPHSPFPFVTHSFSLQCTFYSWCPVFAILCANHTSLPVTTLGNYYVVIM